MKRLIAIVILFSITYLHGQVNKDYDGVKPETEKGAKALVFSYTPFQSNLGGVPTSSILDDNGEKVDIQGIGLKYFLSDKISIVGGFSFGLQSASYDNSYDEKTDVSVTILGISGDINVHMPSLYSVSTYVGGNASLGMYSGKLNIDIGSQDITSEYSSTVFGIGVNIGFDWYFTEGISIGGKYTLGYSIFPSPETTVESTTVEGPSSSYLGTSVGTILLSVHF